MTLAVLGGLVVVPATAAGAAPVSVRFDGGGWGHGVGMGQWGAKGQAEAGRSASQILTHYYQGTSVGPTAMPSFVRVGILQGVSRFTVKSAGLAPGASGDGHIAFGWGNGSGHRDAASTETWEVVATTGGFELRRGGTVMDSFSGTLHVDYSVFGSLVSVTEAAHRYRWGFIDVVHRPNTAAMDVVVQMPSYDQYLYGLGEVPSSWPVAALQAQAIAGRTYAVEKANRTGNFRSGCSCTVFSSVLDQAYVGYDKEAEGSGFGAKWVSAVNATSGQAVLSGGAPIQALYSSSTGGHSEHNEFVFGGTPLSYLRGVNDPWDNTAGNSNHSWSFNFTMEELSNRLAANPSTNVGTVAQIAIVPPVGVSGRVGRVVDDTHGGVRITGVNGSTKRVSGSTIRDTLGLKSTKFAITTFVSHPDGAILKSPSSPTVWVLRNGARWPAWSESSFTSRAAFAEVATVPDSLLNTYPVAGTGYRDGALLRTPDGRVHLISNGVRRWITGESVFGGLGFSSANVRAVTDAELAVHPPGANLSSTAKVPDGVFAKTTASPNVFLMVGGVARPVPTEKIFLSYRAGWGEVVTASAGQLGTPGPAIGFRDGALIRTGDGRVWAVSNQTRRHIANGTVFSTLGYPSGGIIAATDGEAATHAVGAQITGGPHPDGAIVKSTAAPTIWIVKDGIRHPVLNQAAFLSRAGLNEVAVASGSTLAPLPVLSLGWRDGKLLGTPDGRVWLLSNGSRRWITSEQVFNQLGLKFSNVLKVSALDAAVHPRGADVTSGTTYPDGMFIKQHSAAPIYLMVNGAARPLVSWNAFVSWRASMAEVASVQTVPTTGAQLGFRDGTLIKTGDGRVWAVSNGARRWIVNQSAFAALGYDFADVIAVTDQEASTHPQGEQLG